MKYVILQTADGEKTAVCGFHPISHAELAAQNKGHGKPVSAGFVAWTYPKALCFGRSESLNLDPAPADASFLTAQHQDTFQIGLASI